MIVSPGALNTPASIGILLLFCASCAESNYTPPHSRSNQVDQSIGHDLGASYDAQRVDAMPLVSDQGANTQDLYIPPAPADMSVIDPEEVVFTLRRCVERMLNYLMEAWVAAGCDDYTTEQRSDASSPYAMQRVAASCMQLECTGQTLDGHNGVLYRRSCRDIDDVISTLRLVEADVDSGICGVPTFKVKILSLDQHSGPEPCDALTCGLEADGNVIAIDQRN
jgi:hypothetical protein